MTKHERLSNVDQALLVAAFYRGGSPDDAVWTSNSDQIVTLSLFYTGDNSPSECAARFSRKGYVAGLYRPDADLADDVATRYRALIYLLKGSPELIEGGGNFETPADPTFTSCRLTAAGLELACSLIPSFEQKPDFPDWPDKRTFSY